MQAARRHWQDAQAALSRRLAGWLAGPRSAVREILAAPMAPMVALALGATIWAGSTLLAIEAARSDAHERIEYNAEQLRRLVEGRLSSHESLANLLRLMVHHEHGDPFDGFPITEDIIRQQFPAVTYLAFVRRVEHSELRDYGLAIRKHASELGRGAALEIRPARERDHYYFLERGFPQRALGLDFGADMSEHPLIAAMQKTGRASLAVLVHDESGQLPSALMVPARIMGREIGTFAIGLDFQKMLERSIGSNVPEGWSVRLFRQEPRRQVAQASGPPEDHGALDTFPRMLGRFGGNVSDFSDIPFGGEMFSLQVSGPTIATAGLALYLPWTVFLIGMLITTVLYLLVKHIHDARNAASALADLRGLQARQSEQRFRDLVESSSDWIWEVDADFRIRYASSTARQLIGIAPAQLIGRRLQALLMDGQAAFPFGEGLPAAYTGYQRRLRSTDGRELTFESAGTPIYAADGSFDGMRGIDRDVTEQSSFRERLAKLQEELSANMQANLVSQLLSGIAHELNQPLSAIASYNQACIRLLQSGRAEPGQLTEAMRATADNAMLAGDIVRRLRRVTAHREPDVQPASVAALVNNVLALLEHRLRASGIEVSVRMPEALPKVMVDSVLATQVMLNLVHNAADAMAETAVKRISIEASVSQRKVRVSVADTGPGVAPQDASRIFDPYFSTKEQGMGIGLTISRSILEALGGSLECVQAGREPGSGALFVIELPAEGHFEHSSA